MQDERRELWQELCDQAANEKDPRRFASLVEEIIRLLKQKRTVRRSRRSSSWAEDCKIKERDERVRALSASGEACSPR